MSLVGAIDVGWWVVGSFGFHTVNPLRGPGLFRVYSLRAKRQTAAASNIAARPPMMINSSPWVMV